MQGELVVLSNVGAFIRPEKINVIYTILESSGSILLLILYKKHGDNNNNYQ